MAQCEVCGNDYDRTMAITLGGEPHVFDSFECTIHALAPQSALRLPRDRPRGPSRTMRSPRANCRPTIRVVTPPLHEGLVAPGASGVTRPAPS